jgi:circadian clock protein KaiC
MTSRKSNRTPATLRKAPTGISGLDQITLGGLPAGRPTLICGAAGCGKSLFGAEFLVRGILDYDEPGVLMTFEEAPEDIIANVASLGFDLPQLIKDRKLVIDHVAVDRQQIDENGEFDLEGLFIRLAYAVESVGAKRVVLDTIESLFAGFDNQAILRSELRRLFAWLKERGLTTIITGERGDGQLTRQGLEEYVSDCVILLDHRVSGQISTRRLRIVKYRGSTHGTNEFPFLIDADGVSVLPITTATMDYQVSDQRIPSGVEELDDMLDGGYYSGSSILLSGTAGTGKSTLAAHLADATCKRKSKCLYFSFEESPHQIIRNTGTIGLDLGTHVKKGLLDFHSARPTAFGLEMHLVQMHKKIQEFKPDVVVVDPISNLRHSSTDGESSEMLIRLIDFLRSKGITTFLISLTGGGSAIEASGEDLSSIVDTWLLLRDVETYGERNRIIYVLKSRGMRHSNQLREFVITKGGIQLVKAYLGSDGVLTGSARLAQENIERLDAIRLLEEEQTRILQIQQRQRTLEAQIEALRADQLAHQEEFNRIESARSKRAELIAANSLAMGASRNRSSKSKS